MNWVGGARKRLKVKDEKKRQQEFFARQKIKKQLGQRTSSRKGKKPFSLDLLSLQAANFTAKQYSNEGSGSKKTNVVKLERNQFASIRHFDDLGSPVSPCTPSKLQLTEQEAIRSVSPVPVAEKVRTNSQLLHPVTRPPPGKRSGCSRMIQNAGRLKPSQDEEEYLKSVDLASTEWTNGPPVSASRVEQMQRDHIMKSSVQVCNTLIVDSFKGDGSHPNYRIPNERSGLRMNIGTMKGTQRKGNQGLSMPVEDFSGEQISLTKEMVPHDGYDQCFLPTALSKVYAKQSESPMFIPRRKTSIWEQNPHTSCSQKRERFIIPPSSVPPKTWAASSDVFFQFRGQLSCESESILQESSASSKDMSVESGSSSENELIYWRPRHESCSSEQNLSEEGQHCISSITGFKRYVKESSDFHSSSPSLSSKELLCSEETDFTSPAERPTSFTGKTNDSSDISGKDTDDSISKDVVKSNTHSFAEVVLKEILELDKRLKMKGCTADPEFEVTNPNSEVSEQAKIVEDETKDFQVREKFGLRGYLSSIEHERSHARLGGFQQGLMDSEYIQNSNENGNFESSEGTYVKEKTNTCSCSEKTEGNQVLKSFELRKHGDDFAALPKRIVSEANSNIYDKDDQVKECFDCCTVVRSNDDCFSEELHAIRTVSKHEKTTPSESMKTTSYDKSVQTIQETGKEGVHQSTQTVLQVMQSTYTQTGIPSCHISKFTQTSLSTGIDQSSNIHVGSLTPSKQEKDIVSTKNQLGAGNAIEFELNDCINGFYKFNKVQAHLEDSLPECEPLGSSLDSFQTLSSLSNEP